LGDICNEQAVAVAMQNADVVVNFAAESHVDRSIRFATPFVTTNILGTQVLLDVARESKVKLFIQISTDEVGGSLPSGVWLRENSPLAPSSPYAASKAAAEHLVHAANHTHKLPTIIIRISNNYGPFQFPEKLIPLTIANALEFKALPIYGDGLYVRDWIYVEDSCRAIHEVILRGQPGQVYNVGARNERTNLAVVKFIVRLLERPRELITFIEDRPGHDRRYGVDPTKIETELGWRPQVTFKEGLKYTIDWYLRNIEWLANARSGQYSDYYYQHYGNYAPYPSK
jgi:dTDP-glucose 4,6-dehydratase